MIDHDRLFKELLSTFFYEFIELFLPQVAAYLDRDSLTPFDKEVFTDITLGETYEVDLLVQAQFREQPTFFLVHVEHQSYDQAEFGKRMFRYFARLSEKHNLPVYPIVLFSYDTPLRAEPNSYRVSFPDKTVLEFNYAVIQLNRLDWRDYVNIPNPVASALMSKMRIAPEDRVRVKLACLRLLAGLRLNPAQVRLISGFTDIYLRLNQSEETEFQTELTEAGLTAQEEGAMEIVTSWMENGIEIGKLRGELEGFIKLLTIKLGKLDPQVEEQIRKLNSEQADALTQVLLGFNTMDDLTGWLAGQASTPAEDNQKQG